MVFTRVLCQREDCELYIVACIFVVTLIVTLVHMFWPVSFILVAGLVVAAVALCWGGSNNDDKGG